MIKTHCLHVWNYQRKIFFLKKKVMLLPQMSMNKRLNPVPWDPMQGFSCWLPCFHAGFSVLSLRPASCTPTMLLSRSQPSRGICAHWRDFLISLPVLTRLRGMSQLLFSVHSRFYSLPSLPVSPGCLIHSCGLLCICLRQASRSEPPPHSSLPRPSLSCPFSSRPSHKLKCSK